jgi:hypothetical protein
VKNLSSPARIVQTDFRSGEIDPQLYMRVDSKAYSSGAKSLLNCLLHAGGAVSRRPGSTRLTANLAANHRIIPFEFDADEKYIIGLTTTQLIIFDPSGTTVQTFTGGSIPTWTLAQIREITYAQAGNVMILCHPSFRPKVLRRTGLTTFTLTDYNFLAASNNADIYQPYFKFEDAAVTLAISATPAGTGRTVTASSAIFSSSWVGDTIRIFGKECTITAFTSSTQVTVTSKKDITKRLDPNPFLSREASGIVEVTHAFHGMASGASITITGAPTAGGLDRINLNGARTITVLDEDRYIFTAGSGDTATDSIDFGGAAIEITTTAGTREWDEQVFSARRGWPTAVCFYEDRLWFGGSTSLPDGLFSSKSGSYFNFSPGEGDDDASIQVTVGSPRIARIRHLHPGSALHIFTDGGEFVAVQSDGQALTPSNRSIRPQTPFGCNTVKPQSFDGSVLFVQANNKSVREFSYTEQRDSFQGTDITVLSQHLVNGIVDCAVLYGSETKTEQYAFFVNGDGTLAVFHSNRSESLAGWVPWRLRPADTVYSVCSLGSTVYILVNREGRFFLERIEMDDSDVTLDCAIAQTNGFATTVWSLGASYASRTVHVMSNGWYIGSFLANGSGQIVISVAVLSIVAGFSFDWEVIPMPPDTSLDDGPITGQKRRINAVTIHILDTLSLSVDGRPVVITQIGSDLSVPPAPISRKIRHFLFGYDRDPVVVLAQQAPLPVKVLGMALEVSL